MTPSNRPPGIAGVALVVIAGLVIGGLLAVFAANHAQQTRTVASSDAAPAPVQTAIARPTVPPTPAPTVARTTPPTVAPTAPPTVAPTSAPTSTATAAPTIAAPATAATVAAAPAVAADKSVQGAWQIDEANVQVGTIVWSGSAVLSRANTIALNLHKASVGGHPATPCERATQLRAAFSVGVSTQTVPYEEVNCQGAASTGEVRVSSFSSDGRSFHGSFWLGGVNLGNFDARKQ